MSAVSGIKCAFFFIVINWFSPSLAQTKREPYDSSYYETYDDRIPARFYFSKKYTSFDLFGKSGHVLNYRPNTTLNMGIGATYKAISLNLAYGFPFLNNHNESKGKTTYLDMQSHVYRQKFVVDFLGQFYEGYYLHPKGKASPAADQYYQRPEIDVKHFGVAAYYVFNWQKFSFQAAMLQNEWQKKSAGTFMAGAEMYYGRIDGDSAFVPFHYRNDFDQRGINKLRYYNLGIGAGYAYTLVFARHFYIMASINGAISLSLAQETDEFDVGKNDEGFLFIPLYRLAAGYNSDRWIVAALWVNSSTGMNAYYGRYRISTGNARIMLAYRFNNFLKKKDN